MKNKYILTLMICGASLILFILILNLFIRYLDGTIFQQCVIALFCTSIALAIVSYFGLKSFSTFEKMNCILLATSLTFIFSIFGPIFIDRSISYHLVMLASKDQKIEINSLKEIVFNQMLEKRIFELSRAGLIEVDSDGAILSTPRGIEMTKILEWLGIKTDTLEEFKRIDNAIH